MSDLPTPKQLKQLAAACRKAGITSFKGGGIEFTLSAENANPTSPKVNPTVQDLGPNEIESDELSQEALLFWSTGGDSSNDEQKETQ